VAAFSQGRHSQFDLPVVANRRKFERVFGVRLRKAICVIRKFSGSI
jgi:hypothetical protein